MVKKHLGEQDYNNAIIAPVQTTGFDNDPIPFLYGIFLEILSFNKCI